MGNDRDKTISTAIENVCAQWTYASSRRKLYLDWCATIRQSWFIEKVFTAALMLEHAPILADLERIKRECIAEVPSNDPLPYNPPVPIEIGCLNAGLAVIFSHHAPSLLGSFRGEHVIPADPNARKALLENLIEFLDQFPTWAESKGIVNSTNQASVVKQVMYLHGEFSKQQKRCKEARDDNNTIARPAWKAIHEWRRCDPES